MKKIVSIMIILSATLLIAIGSYADEPYECYINFTNAEYSIDPICPPCISGEYPNFEEPICIQWVDWENSRAVLRVDLEDYSKLSLTDIHIKNPYGWVLNIGNSYTNNGAAGDGATFRHDSELQVRIEKNDGILKIYGNDYSYYKPDSDPGPMLEVSGVIKPEKNCSKIKQLNIWDKYMSLQYKKRGRISFGSSYIFRVNNDQDDESETGYNDFIYWIGLNRVVDPINNDCYRCGSGIKRVKFTLLPPTK